MKPFERLPADVIPKHYRLSLTPNLKTFDFLGEVSVDLEIATQTNKIVLNACDIIVKETSLDDGKQKIQPIQTDILEEEEIIVFQFDKLLKKCKYTFTIKYTGKLKDKMKGFYRSKYKDVNGKECYAAVTQFEATDARRCFPCWDEPAIKATFDILLTVPPGMTALSNMPVKKKSKKCDVIHYEFERTPIMSTYLVAIVIGEYDFVEDKTPDGIIIRVYTPLGKKEQGTFALETAKKAVLFYKEYFGISYPLPKMDLVTIADFSTGAMENWGLITYRETALLVDPQNLSNSTKIWVAIVVAHEIAHQWFGNLVTMEWWTHLWLNEGYATFMENLACDKIYPEYQFATRFLANFSSCMSNDSLKYSHPIEAEVGHPSEVDEIFDEISYNKGACVIRMLHHFIGEESFKKGMNLYLTKHQYKNASTDDLWAALEEVSKKPIGEIMSTWTKQMGFPLILVEQNSAGDGNVILKLKQQKFSADGSWGCGSYFWMIPITVSTSEDPTKEVVSTVMDKKEMDITIPNGAACEWIKINPGCYSFYRVSYPAEMLEKFIPALQNQTIPVEDRFSLMSDSAALMNAGMMNTVDILKLYLGCENEDNLMVWQSISTTIQNLRLLLYRTDIYNDFVKFIKKLYSGIYKKVGWDVIDGEDALITSLRTMVLHIMCSIEDEEVITEAKKRFDDHLSGNNKIPADLRKICYKAVISSGYGEAFEKLLEIYKSSDSQEEQQRIVCSLTATKNMNQFKRILEFILSEEVRPNIKMFAVASTLCSNQEGQELAWQFVKDNFNELQEACSPRDMLWGISDMCGSVGTEEMENEVEKLFKDNNFTLVNKVNQLLEEMKVNRKILEKNKDNIKSFLQSLEL